MRCSRGRDLGGGIAHPGSQGGALQLDALAGHDLGLAIQRQVVGVARHEHVRDQRLGGQPALDQPWWRWRLHHRARTRPAGQLGAFGHDDAELRRDHVQPLRGVMADDRHRAAAAGTSAVLGREHHLDPRQMRRQRAASGPALGRAPRTQIRITLLALGLALSDRGLEALQAELQLLLG